MRPHDAVRPIKQQGGAELNPTRDGAKSERKADECLM